MKIFYSLEEISDVQIPISLTIGIFDGMHRGHKHLINSFTKNAEKSAALTFSNHPLNLIEPQKQFPLINTIEERCALLKSSGIDITIVLQFTKDILQMTYKEFLKKIHFALPFNKLYIGENDAFGKNREGTKEAIKAFAPSLQFMPYYIPKLQENDQIISSSLIRKELASGNLIQAKRLLGRPLSFSYIDKNLLKPGRYQIHLRNKKINKL